MLKAVDIKNLFGLYSYFLDFTNPEGTALKFITGPNGYGKTTILSFIHALCLSQLDTFRKIPFDSIRYLFDEETVEIIQHQQNDGVEDDDSDESHQTEVILLIRFYRNARPDVVEETELKGSDGKDQMGRNLGMYLSSLSCYYIKDQRLSHKQVTVSDHVARIVAEETSVSAVKNNADDLCLKLAERRARLNDALSVAKLQFGPSIDEAEYNSRCEGLLPILHSLRKFGLTDESLAPKEYVPANAVFLHAFLVALEKAVDEIAPFVKHLETFYTIIERSRFVNKKMEIHPRYGYRFVMDNRLHTILPSSALSSGEQHILILAYELLFKAQENALVLIDEPEMSFHLMWQMDFLENLKSIMLRRNIQCVIATHSPQIFSQNWKLSVDLYKQSKANE